MSFFVNFDIVSNLDQLIPYSRKELEKLIRMSSDGLSDQAEKISTVVEEVELAIYGDMNVKQLFEAATLVAAQNIQNDIDYDKLATRLLLLSMYYQVLDFSKGKNFEDIYFDGFIDFINRGVEYELLNPEMNKIFDLNKLKKELDIPQDEDYNLIGLSTLENRYALRDRNQKLMELPQYGWMRRAMGMALKEQNPTEVAIKFYKKLSKKHYLPGGSTNIAAGTTFPSLSNCYLLDTEDDTNHIFDNVKNIALISKATGGIGIAVTKLRASGSAVESNNVLSTGPIPFVKVMDTALKSMSRAGKKYGAMAVYMENWHINFPEFLDLRQNAGDDYRRIRTANTAVYISDEFMKRVVNDKEWYMFDPKETSDLTELYGSEFSKRYEEYVEKAKNGEMKMHKVVPARQQMKNILTTLLSTSHPWLTWKDNINLRALNNNTGTIHCSNLCTEICLPQDRENISVCNLAYVNLTKHMLPEAEGSVEQKVDWNLLEETVRVAMRHLDNIEANNLAPIKESYNSDHNNRAVGLGLSGLSESFELLGLAYEDEEAFEFTDKVFEFISYISIDESCNLAEERGSYKNFEGSMWSKGYVPYDTIEKVAEDRTGVSESSKVSSGMVLDQIKSKISSKLETTKSEDSKELLEIFQQLTNLIESDIRKETSESSEHTNSATESQGYLSPGTGIQLTQDRTSRLDWDRLRERVKKGIRNATTMAIAPNASTGLVAGTSPGTDPRFAQIFSRQTYAGKFLDINHNLVKDLKEKGIWEQVKDKVLERYGDISEIDEIPEDLKRIYKTSFQISPYAYIEVASRAQKWIDQAISRNMYLATRDIDEMVEIYTDAWRRGVKTTYYLHSKPRHKAEQSTVRVNKSEKINQSKETEMKVISETTTQTTLDNKEVRGFGFASVGSSIESSHTKLDEDTARISEESKGGSVSGSFGFGSVANQSKPSTSLVERSNTDNNVKEVKVKKSYEIGQACPTDPAERALCESCQ